MSKTVAAIDCGTNTIGILILRKEQDGTVNELYRDYQLAQLGQGVDATNRFTTEALDRAFKICDAFAVQLKRYKVSKIRFIATSAARDAKNRDQLQIGIKQRIGVPAEIISGKEEAQLSFFGALSGITPEYPALVVDLGGGSTELILGTESGIQQSISLNIGSVRIKERFFLTDPPSKANIIQARKYVSDQLENSGINFKLVKHAVGIAGTITSMVAATLKLTSYDRNLVHGYQLTSRKIHALTEKFLSSSTEKILTESCLPPLRAKVISAGALIIDEISCRLPYGLITVSETNVLDAVSRQLLL